MILLRQRVARVLVRGPMQTECIPGQLEFEGFDGRRVVAAFDGGAVTSDAGTVLLREADRAIGLIERVAACFTDHREAEQVVHALPTLIGQRIVAIALGYEDINDHDALRRDPVLALFSDQLEAKRKDCAVLAGKSTINRLEHAPREGGDRYHKIGHDPQALERVFVDAFLDAYGPPPEQIVLDLDATDDPLHGHQEGRFFHGYYDCYCYLPLYVFCGRHLLAAKLRRSNIDAAAGAKDEVARLVAHIRRRWPKVRIVLRADSGFAREELMAWCEANGIDHLFGLARNRRLLEQIAAELQAAEAEHKQTGKPARRFKDFTYATLDSWSRSRRVIGKAEHLDKGANPRFIVTSLEECCARTLYEKIYCARGEMENRMYGRLPPRKRFLRHTTHRWSAAAMYPAFSAATGPLASMRFAGRLPTIKSSSRLCGSPGFCRPTVRPSCHRVEDRPRSSWKLVTPPILGVMDCSLPFVLRAIKPWHDRLRRGSASPR